jgi:hypothetical protein
MKKLMIVLAAALAVFIFAGCASVNPTGNFYSTGTVVMNLRAEETNTVWLGMFGKGTYPLAEKIALDKGINRIATVERYRKIGVFGLWTEYTTVVTGEGPGVVAPPLPPPADNNSEF